MALHVAVHEGPAFAQEPAVEVSEIIRAGKLVGPAFFGLAVDGDGSIFVSGGNSSNVLRYSPRGDAEITPTATSPGNPACKTEVVSTATALAHAVHTFTGPKGVAVGADGTVYVTGTGGSSNDDDDVISVTPDGTVRELVDRAGLNVTDWNPSGIAIDESGGSGAVVYVTGPNGGGTVRIAPDLSFERINTKGGQGLVVDEVTGDVFFAQPGENAVYRIPQASVGVCGTGGKVCDAKFIVNGETGCNQKTIKLEGPYGVALAGDILYVSTQNGHNVIRRPLRAQNALGLPLCAEDILPRDDTRLQRARALAADPVGNVYVAGAETGNVLWLRPDPADRSRVLVKEIINRSSGLDTPQALAVDGVGNVYVSGNTSSNVFRIRTVTAGFTCGNGKNDDGSGRCDYTLDCCCSIECELQPAGASCREAAGDCDRADVCDGGSAVCADGRLGAADAPCRPVQEGQLCDVEERCAGGVSCPTNTFIDADTECRQAIGKCDVPEKCTGSGPDCPADTVLPRDTACREKRNDCDQIERCDGVSALCGDDVRKASQAACVPDEFPASDARCITAASCSEDGTCVPVPKHDGEQCGDFCDDTECQGGACVPRGGPHPCGGMDITFCNAMSIGTECQHCGDGIRQEFEACDDGNRVGGDGCTPRCELSCDRNVLDACGQPLLAPNTPDPCRKATCEPVNLNPMSDDDGFACETRTVGCTGCTSALECPTDACHDARCEDNRCVAVEKSGFALATCGFAEAFPGDELSTGDAGGCSFGAAPGSRCAPSGGKNQASVLCRVRKAERAALALLNGKACRAGSLVPKPALERRIQKLLVQGRLRANRFASIDQACEDVLTARFQRIAENFQKAIKANDACVR
jgi:cysteine-rich repeat protein